VPDIGFGEIIMIVVVALLVFGPDRLPKVAADAARTLRQVRQMAASARKDLVDAAGIEQDEELSQAVRDLRDLDPRRAMDGVLTDAPTPTTASRAGQRAPGASTSAPRPGSPPVAGSGPGTGSLPGTVPAAGAQPVAPPVVAPAAVDPDWT
jgi:sec-independent protein translocase protein TatB